MLRKIMVVLAITLALGGFAPSGSASARGGDYGGGRGLGHAVGDGHGSYDGRVKGLRSGFHEYRRGDAWGHWGAYYGPMIPMP